MTSSRHGVTGQSSATNGYTTGTSFSTGTDRIDKFSFSSDSNAANIGNTTSGRYGANSSSSTTHGYYAGGYDSAYRATIDKFSFITDGNGTNIGNLTIVREKMNVGQQY